MEAIETRSFARDADSPGKGRRLLESALGGLPGAVLADAQLLLTEVLSNAVLHGSATGDSPLEVSVATDDSTVRVSVTDGTAPFARPAIRRPEPTAASGWGLYLLERLAKRWGVEDAPDGRSSVWFELQLSASDDGERHRDTSRDGG